MFFLKKSLKSTRLLVFNKKYHKTAKLWNIITIKKTFYLNINLFLCSKLYFQHHYSSLQSWSFRNHFWLSSVLKTVVLLHIRNYDTFSIFRILWWIECSKEQHLFELPMLFNILNVFTLTSLLLSKKQTKNVLKLVFIKINKWQNDE